MEDTAVLPRDAEAEQRLLELATIERLLYEIRYEVTSRPEWAKVPLRDLATHGSR
jgi:predicted trehalose synthase